ncbi:MAG TPA: transglycosylase SLT domain-containing protein [Polyangia bacterium]|nr:transglycosylase SLT domain-containing protein [Polyangia bacterium]
MKADIFNRHADGLPVEFLKALAYHESGLDPAKVNPASNATGLFQITAPVLIDFNKTRQTTHTLTDLKDADLAAAVAVYHLKRIIAHWKESPALAADFDNRRFVELLVFGWNAGPNAVLRIATRLEKIGVAADRITVDAVHDAAKAVAPETFVARPERVGFAKQVAATYFDVRDGRGRMVAELAAKDDKGSLAPAVMAAIGVGAAAVAVSENDG